MADFRLICPCRVQVILLITGTLHERDTHELLERCHPLGVFDTMPALCVASNTEELYNTVLVETPLGSSSGGLARNLCMALADLDYAMSGQHPTFDTACLRQT